MSATRWGSALALAAAVGAGCASAPAPDGPAPPGCFQFERNAGARALRLPWGVELEDAALDGRWPIVDRLAEVRRARTATSPVGRADHPFGYWRRTEADSVEIGYPGGGGIALVLAAEGQDLIGHGLAVGDARVPGEPPGARGPFEIVARRVLCGAL